jgi:DNA-binding transcriptional LysR family regulator
MTLEMRHIRMLLALAEELSFTRAAARLGLPTSALSTQLARIEGWLQTRIFERSTRQVTLSVAGERLLPYLRAAESAVSHIEAMSQESSHAPATSLRIATEQLWAGYTISSANGVAQAFTHVDTDRAYSGFNDGDFEVIQTSEELAYPLHFPRDTRIATVVHEPLWLMLPDHHQAGRLDQVSLKSLVADLWVAHPPDTSQGTQLRQACEDVGFTPEVRYHVTSDAALLDVLRHDNCICLVSPAQSPPHGYVLRRLDVDLSRRILLAWRPRSCPTVLAREFLAVLRAAYARRAQANVDYWSYILGNRRRFDTILSHAPSQAGN